MHFLPDFMVAINREATKCGRNTLGTVLLQLRVLPVKRQAQFNIQTSLFILGPAPSTVNEVGHCGRAYSCELRLFPKREFSKLSPLISSMSQS